MSSWSLRLSKVQASYAQVSEVEPIGHLSLTELKATPMSFGKAHMGKTYEEIWNSDPQWIKWFLSHYAASTKTEHRKMILFIQLMIEESEKETPQPSAKALPKALAARPKSQAAPAMQMPVSTETEVESFEMMSEAPWIEASETREDIHALQTRLLSLENAMQRMIALMSRGPSPSHAMVPEGHPETATTVWDDPWNN